MTCGACQGVAYFPMLVGIVMMGSFVTTYIVSVLTGHVDQFFPYISDTGVELPERGIFSQFINIAALLAAITLFLRYRYIRDITEGACAAITRLSQVNLVLGMFSSLGQSIVANFQETLPSMHYLGATMVFVGGLIYMLLDSIISYKMSPAYNTRCLSHIRLSLTLIGISALIISVTAKNISSEECRSVGCPTDSWDPSDPGYTGHIVSTFGEWFMAVTFLSYFFSYIKDFQNLNFTINTSLISLQSKADSSNTHQVIHEAGQSADGPQIDTNVPTVSVIVPNEKTGLLHKKDEST